MSAFHTRPFNMRFAEMGDLAEKTFEEVWPGAWERFGLNRPNLNMAKLTPFVRCTPDYITHTGLIEVMGVGRDKTLKFKEEKWGALQDWALASGTAVFLFLFDSHRKQWSCVPLDDVVAACIAVGDYREFHDGPRYAALPMSAWPGEWTAYVEAPALPDPEEDF